MRRSIHALPIHLITEFLTVWKPILFRNPTDFVYEGHIPIRAVLLLDGSVELFQSKNKILHLEKHEILGLKELMHGRPLQARVHLHPNSQIIMLDKDSVRKIINNPQQEMRHYFQKIIND